MYRLPCPVCAGSTSEQILSLPCGITDDSTLYPTVKLLACTDCSHTYNNLTTEEITGLGTYYEKEYAPANLASIVRDGDLPGSTGAFTLGRYGQLYNLLTPHLRDGADILDVGCAVGGFLDFLDQHGSFKLHGVDMTETYVNRAREKGFNVAMGDAERLPFSDRQFDVLVVEQVLEHLVHPAYAFQEASRVLKANGVLCIGVPDASRYNELYYFDFYWLLMREHIQHFQIGTLTRLAGAHGFELIEFRQSALPIMGEAMVMPNLSATFRYTGKHVTADTAGSSSTTSCAMKVYVTTETARLDKKRSRIRELANSRRPVYAWGVGRELLYLYEAAGLKHCNLAGFIDMNPFKQRTVTIAGKSVEGDSSLAEIGEQSLMLISAIAHEVPIRQKISQTSFRGKIVELV